MNIRYTSSQGNIYIQRKPMNDLTQHKPLSSHLLFFLLISYLLYLHFLFTPPPSLSSHGTSYPVQHASIY